MGSKVIAMVPSLKGQVLVATGGKEKIFKTPAEAADWLSDRQSKNGKGEAVVLAIMGGPGQELFSRFLQMGVPVLRAPIYQLQLLKLVEKGSLASARAIALQAAWETNREIFYPLEELDPTILMIRELTRQRLAIQDFRKPATNRLHGALRRLEFVLPPSVQQLVGMLREGIKSLFRKPELREQIEGEFKRLDDMVLLSDREQANLLSVREFLSNPAFILGLKADELELESRIAELVRTLPIWPWLNPKDSVLPGIKGMGPSIGGSIVSEIGDIRRFPTKEALRAYARFHVSTGGGFPKRVAHEIASWNRYLNRAVWLWSTDQMPRYDHQWRLLYDWKKAQEMQKHPEPVAREMSTITGANRIVHDFTLKHLDSRAKRWTGSQLLNYIWALWQEVASGRSPEEWYPKSTWPAYFDRVQAELDAGLAAYLKAEIPNRRRSEPKTEEEETEEF